jgi:hypothetical protein
MFSLLAIYILRGTKWELKHDNASETYSYVDEKELADYREANWMLQHLRNLSGLGSKRRRLAGETALEM